MLWAGARSGLEGSCARTIGGEHQQGPGKRPGCGRCCDRSHAPAWGTQPRTLQRPVLCHRHGMLSLHPRLSGEGCLAMDRLADGFRSLLCIGMVTLERQKGVPTLERGHDLTRKRSACFRRFDKPRPPNRRCPGCHPATAEQTTSDPPPKKTAPGANPESRCMIWGAGRGGPPRRAVWLMAVSGSAARPGARSWRGSGGRAWWRPPAPGSGCFPWPGPVRGSSPRPPHR